ncbi:uncharacterized protein THITE_2107101 [Thermothielavioides terrestris NRRL 8126]|uniref:MARVEL domain-containing protein n=2 Tax=Thermothielavioides terrestris TaxID=2587410 RepID=G2QST9_THETT|nr:uncharacterized protein THITE_2107101 [Thermothielavioides terrestris NRRL 8126]AEO62664.1 hypothetical protein THITE_2107101 [Thermothielavioides terrestris NRRL 8126]
MGAASGIALRGTQLFIRTIQFCCAAIVLAIFSYFLATLNIHNLPIGVWVRAVEGISGAAVLYTVLALLLLCCVAGHSFPSFVGTVFDVAFIAGFIYIAFENRGGASSCTGEVDTPYGRGNADTNVVDNGSGGLTTLPSLRQACKMETACLSVSIVAIFFFALSPFVSHALVRHRRKEKRFGPSPANNYTEGSGAAPKRFNFFGLGRKRTAATDAGPDPNALPKHTTPNDIRESYATEQTRVGSSGGGYGGLGDGTDKYESPWANRGNDIPLAHYPNASTGYRYENNGDVYR